MICQDAYDTVSDNTKYMFRITTTTTDIVVVVLLLLTLPTPTPLMMMMMMMIIIIIIMIIIIIIIRVYFMLDLINPYYSVGSSLVALLYNSKRSCLKDASQLGPEPGSPGGSLGAVQVFLRRPPTGLTSWTFFRQPFLKCHFHSLQSLWVVVAIFVMIPVCIGATVVLCYPSFFLLTS